jgi:uncharacterized protein YqgV (UPF0045/DUF77 family)
VDSKVSKMGMEFHKDFVKEALAYCNKIGVKLYCGEFGTNYRAPIADTLRWVQDVTKMLHEYNIGFALWTYKEMDFGILYEHYDSIREEILMAIFNKKQNNV